MIITFKFLIIFFCVIIFLWYLAYKALTTKSKSTISMIVTLILIVFSFRLMSFVYDIYAEFDKMTFSKNMDGAIQLPYSPMRIPNTNKMSADYCAKFKNEDSSPIKDYFVDSNNNLYCGLNYYHPNSNYMYPFKKLKNGDVIFWAAPEKRIICKAPCKVSKFNY